jgi:hypothetical protein
MPTQYPEQSPRTRAYYRRRAKRRRKEEAEWAAKAGPVAVSWVGERSQEIKGAPGDKVWRCDVGVGSSLPPAAKSKPAEVPEREPLPGSSPPPSGGEGG